MNFLHDESILSIIQCTKLLRARSSKIKSRTLGNTRIRLCSSFDHFFEIK